MTKIYTIHNIQTGEYEFLNGLMVIIEDEGYSPDYHYQEGIYNALTNEKICTLVTTSSPWYGKGRICRLLDGRDLYFDNVRNFINDKGLLYGVEDLL